MNRRKFIKLLAALPVVGALWQRSNTRHMGGIVPKNTSIFSAGEYPKWRIAPKHKDRIDWMFPRLTDEDYNRLEEAVKSGVMPRYYISSHDSEIAKLNQVDTLNPPDLPDSGELRRIIAAGFREQLEAYNLEVDKEMMMGDGVGHPVGILSANQIKPS